jgi:galactose mutarotase-like enzyme
VKLSHREEQRGDRLLDVLTDEDGGLRLIVSRLGAELISMARRDVNGEWIGFLHRDNDLTPAAKGWGNHATVMGYYLHRLNNEHTLYRGHEIRGGTHSFLRTKTWRLQGVDAEAGAVTYRITPADFTPTEYPLRVSIDLTYGVRGGDVEVQFAFTNDEPDLTAHVGFGLHPGFAAQSFDSFRLEMPAGLYRRHFSPENYLSGETEDIQFPGGEMPFDRSKLPGSYILELVDVPNRRFTFSDAPSRRAVSLEMLDVPYLTLWSDGGAFLCVEPCWGLTDRHQQRAFEDKEGIQVIAAGGKLIRGFTMSPRLED